MRITHLELRNWRNFRQVKLPISDRLFLVGPNASGKSNLLDAFRFLRDVAKTGGGLLPALAARGGLSKVRCLAARQYPELVLDVQLNEPADGTRWRYRISVKQESRGKRQPFLTEELVERNEDVILRRPNSDDQQDQARLTQTFLEQINSNKDFRPIAEFLSGVQYLHLVPQLVRNPDAFSGPGLPGDPFGRSFLERVARTQERTRRSRLSKIERALRAAVPQLSSLSHIKDEAGIPHLEAVYEHWRAQGARQREDQFSDGTLRLIGLFWSLLDSDELLLLEEPELSLNNDIVRRLPGLISVLLRRKRRQVIITTHSEHMLLDEGIGLDEVALLSPGKEGTKVHPAADDESIRRDVEAGLSLAEAILPLTSPKSVDDIRNLTS